MHSIADTLAELVRQYPAWTDTLIGVGIIVQGEITLFLAMFMVVSGALPWREFFLSTLGTLIVGELVVFFAGRLIRHTRLGWRWYRRMKPNRRIQYYSHYLRENLVKLFLISHFLVGVNFIVLILTGWSKTSFGKFLRSYLVGLLTWFGAMALIAYSLMSGLSYLRSTRVFRQVEIGIVVIILLILGGEYLFRKSLKGQAAMETKAKALGRAIEKKLEAAAAPKEKKEEGTAPPTSPSQD
jgi:membrane protein DedA with SNARE-associated domain